MVAIGKFVFWILGIAWWIVKIIAGFLFWPFLFIEGNAEWNAPYVTLGGFDTYEILAALVLTALWWIVLNNRDEIWDEWLVKIWYWLPEVWESISNFINEKYPVNK